MQSPPRKILLAADLSPRCDRAFDRAVGLASTWGAQLAVVHALAGGSTGADTLAIPTWRRPPDSQELA
jgi:nucleotide-binding universal stress UspA family protein